LGVAFWSKASHALEIDRLPHPWAGKLETSRARSRSLTLFSLAWLAVAYTRSNLNSPVFHPYRDTRPWKIVPTHIAKNLLVRGSFAWAYSGQSLTKHETSLYYSQRHNLGDFSPDIHVVQRLQAPLTTLCVSRLLGRAPPWAHQSGREWWVHLLQNLRKWVDWRCLLGTHRRRGFSPKKAHAIGSRPNPGGCCVALSRFFGCRTAASRSGPKSGLRQPHADQQIRKESYNVLWGLPCRNLDFWTDCGATIWPIKRRCNARVTRVTLALSGQRRVTFSRIERELLHVWKCPCTRNPVKRIPSALSLSCFAVCAIYTVQQFSVHSDSLASIEPWVPTTSTST